jgi:hypothetical protein
VVTYTGPADRFINNNASNEENRLVYTDSEGNYYYTSYPQFGYIAPYLFFKIIFVEPNIVGLRIFSILIQICTALLISAIVYKITKQQSASAVAFSAYMLFPNHIDNYMSDMLVLLFFVSTSYLFLKIATEDRRHKASLILFAISMFLMVYTEYLGVLVAGTVFLYTFSRRKESSMRSLMWINVLVPACAMLLVVIQYALVSDIQTFLSVMTNRYANSYVRLTNLQAIIKIVVGYWRWYGPAIVALAGMLLMLWTISFTSRQKKWLSPQEGTAIRTAIFIFAVPVLIHHAALLQWTAYHTLYISLLKTGPLVAFCVAMLFWLLVYRSQVTKPISRNVLAISLILVCAYLCAPVYIKNYRPPLAYKLSYCEAGELMARHAPVDSVVFVKDAVLEHHVFPLHPTIVTCAGRNIAIYKGESAAEELMRKNNVTSGMIFTLAHFEDEGVEIIRTETVNLDN